MRMKKPDILVVLSLFLLMGIVMNSYGSQLLESIETENRYKTYAHLHKELTHKELKPR